MARRLDALPATLDAAAEGAISAGQARAAAQALRDLPREALDGLDQLVAGTGPGVDAGQLRSAIDDYAHRVVPESLAERARERRRFAITRSGDGGARIEGFVDVLGAETVSSALAPLAAHATRTTTAPPSSAWPTRSWSSRVAAWTPATCPRWAAASPMSPW